MNIDHSARYHALLNQVQGVMRETQQIDRDTEELSQELSRQLEDTKSQVQQKRVAFHKEKKTLCSKSVNTRTGAEMGSKVLVLLVTLAARITHDNPRATNHLKRP